MARENGHNSKKSGSEDGAGGGESPQTAATTRTGVPGDWDPCRGTWTRMAMLLGHVTGPYVWCDRHKMEMLNSASCANRAFPECHACTFFRFGAVAKEDSGTP
jgi:hypothetical protein